MLDERLIDAWGNAADALLGRTFFNGIKWDPEILADRCESPLILPTHLEGYDTNNSLLRQSI